MKTNFKTILFHAIFISVALAFTFPPNSIVGKWTIMEPDGSKSFIDFTATGRFTYTNKGKIIHYGIFKMSNDTFSISDH